MRDGSVSPSVVDEIDRVCERFDAAWKSGSVPHIEDELASARADLRRRLLAELLSIELARHSRWGELPDKSAYRERFANDRDLVDAAFRPFEATCSHAIAGDTSIEDNQRNEPFSLPSWSSDRFNIVEFHAQGGLGRVYRAEDRELNREVALKEIRPDRADRRSARARFAVEAEITGGLEHPGIVPVYSLGQRNDGRPFYAMRFIRGESLSDAIARHHERIDGDEGDLRALLRRFIDVCNAVAYAHSRGVIHRDIKPANVMLGDFGETLLVDWGLAKTTGKKEGSGKEEARGEGSTRQFSIRTPIDATFPGAALGTPRYMSPEQAAGDQDAVGTASDIYSLGATLYAILTGRAPIARADLDDATSGPLQSEIVRPREISPHAPKPLEAICLKAMSANREQRYASARDLAAQIERYLADEPVAAYRDSVTERVARWTRRHKAWTQAGAGALAIVAVVAIGATLLVNQQRIKAQQAQRHATAVSEYLIKAFESPDPDRDGRDITVAELLDRTAAKLDTDLPYDPLLRGTLLDTLGRTYLGLGLAERAQGVLERARELRELTLGANHPRTLQTLNNVAAAMQMSGQYDKAISLFENVLARRRKHVGATNPETFSVMDNLASAYLSVGRFGDAMELYRAVMEGRRKSLGPQSAETLGSQIDLGRVYQGQGDYARAAELLRETRTKCVASLGLAHLETLRCTLQLAQAVRETGGQEESVDVLEEGLAAMTARLGLDHPTTLAVLNDLAVAYSDAGRHDDAIPLVERSLEQHREALGPSHLATLAVLNNVANLHARAGHHELAVGSFEEGLRLALERHGDMRPTTLTLMYNLGFELSQSNRQAEALPLLSEAYSNGKVTLGPTHPHVIKSAVVLAGTLDASGRPDLAVPICEEEIATCRRLGESAQLQLAQATRRLATHLQHAGRLNEALVRSDEALNLTLKIASADDEETLIARNNRALILQALRNFDLAIPEFEKLLETRRANDGEEHLATLLAMHNLAGAYQQAGRLADAIPLLEAALGERRRLLGSEHADTLTTLNNLAMAYQDSGRLADAVIAMEEAAAGRRTTLGADHPDTLTAQGNLAGAYADAGRLDEAIATAGEAAARHESIAGRDHPNSIALWYNLATYHRDAGRIDEAVAILIPLVERANAALGPDHPISATLRTAFEQLNVGVPPAGGAHPCH